MYNYEKEKQEAIDAGYRALNSLQAAHRELEGAQNWGFFDILGGGMISSLLKRDKMENARRYLNDARYDLKNFSRELRDVDASCDLNLQTGDFLSFADWFFDGFFVDLMMQSRIKKGLTQVEDAIDYVNDILDRLEEA